MDRDALGRYGETIAERFLASKGFRIVARRWRAGRNDIDLVAIDRGEVVFVEVKARAGAGYGTPEEAVTAAKRRHLRASAAAYVAAHGLDGRPYRIDVVAVEVGPARPIVRHLRAAVGEED